MRANPIEEREKTERIAVTSGPKVFMPLRINLLHEQQAEVRQRKRDPLKIGTYILGGVAGLLILWYLYQLSVYHVLQNQLHERQALWARKYENPVKSANAKQHELERINLLASDLTRRIENRFYWGPVLDLFLQIVPKDVQISNLTGTVDQQDDKHSHVSLALEGLAAGQQPRADAERFRVNAISALATKYKDVSASFQTLDETGTAVLLDNQNLPTVKFNILITFSYPNPVAPLPTPAPAFKPKPPPPPPPPAGKDTD